MLAGWRIKAASYALAGNADRAAATARKVLELDPSARISTVAPLVPLRREEDRARWSEGLLKAGLPA